jgi:hypothetical protein
MSSTLLLDRSAWDLCIDADGNIAMATGAYALAQDAASAIKLFLSEYWYNTSIGIPYFQQILGLNPPVNLIKTQMQNAALTVPNVVSATVYISAINNGQVSGQVQVTDNLGQTGIANF